MLSVIFAMLYILFRRIESYKCESSDIKKIVTRIKELLEKTFGTGIEVIQGDNDNWAGFIAARCCDKDEDLGLSCNVDCNAKILEERPCLLLEIVEKIAKEFQNIVSIIIVSAAPVIPPWGPSDITTADVYLAWMRRDVPNTELELLIYKYILGVFAPYSDGVDSVLSYVISASIPFSAGITDIANNLNLKKLGEGFLFKRQRPCDS